RPAQIAAERGPAMETIHARPVILAWIAKAEGRAALAIQDAEEGLGVKGGRGQPGNLGAKVPEALGSERPRQNQRIIHKRPLMRMLGVLAAKVGKELSRLDLEVSRQGYRLKIGFFEFDLGLVVRIQLEDDVAERFEVRIHRAIKCDLGIAQRETAFDGIVVAKLQKS